MNYRNTLRAKCLKLKTSLFSFLLIIFYLLPTPSFAQTKSSIQVDSINVKKVGATLPTGTNSNYILTIDASGNINKGITIGQLIASFISANPDPCTLGTGAIGSMIDSRDGSIYTVKNYGGSAGCWMTQNLKYPVSGAWTIAGSTVYTLGASTSGTTIGMSDMQSTSINIGTAYNINGTVRTPSLKNHFDTLGVLYNWNMAMTNYTGATGSGTNPSAAVAPTTVSTTQGICPTGWVLPSNQDFANLVAALSATDATAGTMMKITIDMNGNTQSPRGTNSVGWNGFLTGSTNNLNAVDNPIGSYAVYWSSSESSNNGYYRYLQFSNAIFNAPIFIDKTTRGYSVRCRK